MEHKPSGYFEYFMKNLHFLESGCTVVAFPYNALDLEASKEIALAVILY